MTTTLQRLQPILKATMAFLVLLSTASRAQAPNPPTATAASAVTANSFTANWQPVAGATSYRLDVSTSPTFDIPTVASGLMITEYVEGGPGYKAVEIYNGTGASVNMAGLFLRRQIDGGTTIAIFLSGTMPNNSTRVYAYSPGIAPDLQAVATNATTSSTLNFDGNDAMQLVGSSGIIDIVGIMDTAVPWGADVTLRRKSSVTGPSATYSASDWDVYPTNDITGLGSHTINATPSFVPGYEDLTVNGTVQSVSGLTGNTTYYYRVRAVDANGTSTNSNVIQVKSALDAPVATAATSVGATSFTANWDPVPGATSYALDVSTSPTFGTTTLPTDLIISEYVEGSNGDKVIELYNGTGAPVTLNGPGAGYRLSRQLNGAGSFTLLLALSGVIPNNSTYVLASPTSSPAVLAVANVVNANINFTGNDAITLGKIGVAVIDIVGVPNQVADWGADVTLVRKPSVIAPPFSATYSPGEWDAYPVDTFSNLGSHTMNTFTGSFVPGYENLTVNGTSQLVSGLTPQTVYYYRVRAVGPDGTSINSNIIQVTTLAQSTFGSIAQAPGIACQDEAATFNLTGLTPNSTYTISYNIDGGPTQTATGVIADASGNASMQVTLGLANDGQTLTVTSVERTDVPSTVEPVTTNNTVVIDITERTTFYVDNDQDGYGDNNSPVQLCEAVPGVVTDNTDCDDNNDAVNPGAQEICNGIDDDCDGFTDGDDPSLIGTLTLYADTDTDGYGDNNVAIQACSATTGYVADNTDCNDNAATIHPGAAEIGYNLVDDDCDGSIDEGFPPKITVIQSAMCNTTLPALDTQIIANLVAGAQGYRWRITTMTGPNAGQVQFLDSSIRTMKLTALPNYAFATQYKGELAVYYAGFLQPFNPSNCTVTTPTATTSLTVCGQTLTAMTNVIYANMVPYATGYRFRITDPLNAGNTQVIDRPMREFRMNLITNFLVQWNKSYNVEVAIKNTDGTYLPYGPVCSVTTPLFPTTSLQDAMCENYAVPTNATQIYAITYPGAISYAFNLTGPGLPLEGIEIVKNVHTFSLNEFTGLIAGAIYDVRVRMIFSMSEPAGPYGKVCTIMTPGLAREAITKTSFDAVAYPNPFASDFNIDITTSQSQDIQIKVYDMMGRQLDNQNVKASQMASFKVGDGYPSGVYNVIVSQGDEVKTLRVIKR
jgi:hypothetical protein